LGNLDQVMEEDDNQENVDGLLKGNRNNAQGAVGDVAIPLQDSATVDKEKASNANPQLDRFGN